MIALLLTLMPPSLIPLALIPLESVTPSRGNGFAASILGAFLALGLLAIVAKFATTKPKNRRRPPR